MSQPLDERGDFSAEFRLVWISALALVIGVICAFVAVALLWLIGFFTELFYFQHFTLHIQLTRLPAPGDNTLGAAAVVVPVIGGLIIGLMARYGSERIRGHGIPEAMEAILIGQSRMLPKVAVLKPLSSAISIGSGGPFGAEGPIIMTGGAFGSIIAQMFNLTAAERKALLVAGAAGGMSATFATPLAAVLLAVELLLFEWKPRSLIPVAVASIIAALVRPYLIGYGPIFPVPLHQGSLELGPLACAAFVGLTCGILSMLLTGAVYAAEDAFHRLPIHWMWWPAIGGLVIGVGGYFQPRALGVGYDIIEELLTGRHNQTAVAALIGLIVVKSLIWSIALGSGTSGGVLAPLLIIGGSLGALESYFLPGHDPALWPLVSMAGVLGGTMRSPLTAVVFGLELTYDFRTLPALLIAAVVSHGYTVLVMKRSILTEKVARRGYHVSREYSVDYLELLKIEEVMSPDVVTVPAALPLKDLVEKYFLGHGPRKHQGYPVVDGSGNLLGIVTKTNLLEDWISPQSKQAGDTANFAFGPIITYDLIHGEPITAYPWESCRLAAERMAHAGVGRLLVVSAEDPKKLVGIVTRSDLLKPHARRLEEEVKRERFIRIRRRRVGQESQA